MITESTPRLAAVHVELAALPTAPALARSFARHALLVWRLSELADTVELITSELVTNAVRATGPGTCGNAVVGLELRVHRAVLRISVEDGSDERPAPRSVSSDDENGRGLLLVELCSRRWDVEPKSAGGKVTWAELDAAAEEFA